MSWRRLTTMGMNIPTTTSASGSNIIRPGLSISAILFSRHRNSSTCWNFQRTPFCFRSNSPPQVHLALLPAANYVVQFTASGTEVVGLFAGVNAVS